MKFGFAPAVLVPLLLVLSACEEEAADVDTSETGGKAAGEVLGGTISDDMLPLEELTSTSPPAAPAATATAVPGGGETGAETAEGGASEEAPPPEESAAAE